MFVLNFQFRVISEGGLKVCDTDQKHNLVEKELGPKRRPPDGKELVYAIQ